jgi:hypothetical protein
MTIDEKDAGQRRPVYEMLDRLAAEIDKKRAETRATAAPLFEELEAAQSAGDLSLAGRIFKRIAAHFEAAGCHGAAQTYRLDAAACTDALRRRTWIENRKAKRR